AGREHLAQDDFADLVRLDAGLREQRGDDLRAEFGRGNLADGAAELADRGAQRADYDYIIHSRFSSRWLGTVQCRARMSWKPPAIARQGKGGAVYARVSRLVEKNVALRLRPVDSSGTGSKTYSLSSKKRWICLRWRLVGRPPENGLACRSAFMR